MHNIQGRPIVVIEWQAHPVVEVRDIVPKQRVSEWLELSQQRKWVFLTMCHLWYNANSCLVQDTWKFAANDMFGLQETVP